MPLIDKEKTVESIATFLFVNDAIRGPEPKKVRDYLVFAESMLKDVPHLIDDRIYVASYIDNGEPIQDGITLVGIKRLK